MMSPTHETFAARAIPLIDGIYRFAYSLTSDARAAEDLVQETYVSALRRWRSFPPDASCRLWLLAICQSVFMRPPVWKRRDAPLQDGASLDAAIRSWIADLEPRLRVVVVLVDVERCTYREAATVLSVPVETIRLRLHRGRELLRERLLPHQRGADLLSRRLARRTG